LAIVSSQLYTVCGQCLYTEQVSSRSNISDLHSKGAWFKTQLVHQLFNWYFSWFSLVSPDKCARIVQEIRSWLLPFTPFPVH
jgi:hypothetical protein